MPKWANIITSHQLLIHSSGLVNYTSLPEFKDTMLSPPEMPALVSSFKNRALDFPIGFKYSYSNSGYLLLGEIIQQLTGQALHAYLEQTFFKPLNMIATFLAIKGTVHDLKKMNQFKELARGYEIDVTSEKPVIKEVEKYWHMQMYIPSLKLSIICLSNIAPSLEKMEPEINKIKAQLPVDLNPSEEFEIIDAELKKKFPAMTANKDRYFTTEFATNLVKVLSSENGLVL